MNIALITAAGKGIRFENEIPKQFVEVYGKPIIIYTLEKFQNNENIDAIIVACLKGWEEKLKEYVEKYNITKLKWIVEGGATVVDSISNCVLELKKYCRENDIVIQHSADRCLVSDFIINDSIETFKKYGSAIASVPGVEYMLEKNEIGKCIEIPREKVFKIHTPNVFSLEKMIWAYEERENRNIKDVKTLCDLMVKLNEKLAFSKSNSLNMKITTKEDLEIFKAIVYKN